MFKNILLPTDGSALSLRAAKAAIELARERGGALVAIAVAEPVPDALDSDGFLLASSGLDGGELLAAAEARARAVAELAQAAGVACRTATALSYHPWEEILKAAADFHCDVVFMASHGRAGLGRLLLGSETQKVLAHAQLPVLVFR